MKRIYPVRNKSPRAAAAVPVAGRISNGIYLDSAASTPVASEVITAMRPYFNERFGNPGSLHFFGQEAMGAIDKAREIVSKAIGANFREIIFTGSATEANNLALRGAVKSYQHKFAEISINQRPRLIVSAIEHESVLETARDLERSGVEVVYLPVDCRGLVDLIALKKSLNERTILVSIMFANNEIGVIEPILAIAEEIRKWKLENRKNEQKNSKFHFLDSVFPLFHTDAVQAFQFLDCDVNKLGVDLMTLSAHKIYGPKGVGVLYVRSLGFKHKDLRNENKPFVNHESYFLNPILTGGGQEFGLRSGTENVPAIVGFGKAIELAASLRKKETRRILELQDCFLKELKKIYPQAEINGYGILNLKSKILNLKFLPNILNIYFPGKLSEDMVVGLDLKGIAVSAGSACSSRASKLSHVLLALGFKEERVRNSVRFSLGRFTTEKDISETLRALKTL